MVFRTIALPLAFALLLAGCAKRTLLVPADPAALLDDTIPRLMEKHNVPGVAISLVVNGEVVLETGYGTDGAGGRLSANTPFQIASLSKPVAALALLKLAEDEPLDLNQPIDHIPGVWLPEQREGVGRYPTLVEIARHNGGLSVGGYYGQPNFDASVTLLDVLEGRTPGDGRVVQREPAGKRFNYSGGGYSMIQNVIEAVSGLPFREYVRRSVLEPLEIKANYLSEGIPATGAALGHNQAGTPVEWHYLHSDAAGGLIANISSWRLFMENYWSNDLAITNQSWALVKTRSPVGPYGMGHNVEMLDDQQVLLSHTGANPGFKTFFAVEPASKFALAVFTNSDSGDGLYREVEALFIR